MKMITHTQQCSDCDGTGIDKEDSVHCYRCDGEGAFVWEFADTGAGRCTRCERKTTVAKYTQGEFCIYCVNLSHDVICGCDRWCGEIEIS